MVKCYAAGFDGRFPYAGVMLGGHVRAVFTLVTFIFIACVIVTLYSFSEIPLNVLSDVSNLDSIKVS